MGEKEVKEFIQHMKDEIARIPGNLSKEELLRRHEDCLSLAEGFQRAEERFKAKKYEILAQKYKQLYLDYGKPKPAVVVAKPQIVIEETIETPVKVSKIKVIFGKLKFWGKDKSAEQKNK